MEKDDKIEINAELLMEHADKIVHHPALGTSPALSELIEEIEVDGQIYELRLELTLKGWHEASEKLIV